MEQYKTLIGRYPLSEDEYNKMKELNLFIPLYPDLYHPNVNEAINKYIDARKESSKLNDRFEETKLKGNYDIYDILPTIKNPYPKFKPFGVGGNSNKSRRTRKSKKSKKSRKCKNYKK